MCRGNVDDQREEEVFDRSGTQLAGRRWKGGKLLDQWTKKDLDYYERGEIPPRLRARKRRDCLNDLAKGGCCEWDSSLPPRARICENGEPR